MQDTGGPKCRTLGVNPWVGKIPWRREWLPTPILLPGEVHGQRSLEGYSPWGRKESDTTERLTRSLHFIAITTVAVVKPHSTWALESSHLDSNPV